MLVSNEKLMLSHAITAAQCCDSRSSAARIAARREPCEHYRLPASRYPLPFHIDHIVARQPAPWAPSALLPKLITGNIEMQSGDHLEVLPVFTRERQVHFERRRPNKRIQRM